MIPKFRAWDKVTHKIYDVTCIDFYNEVAEIIIEYENPELMGEKE